MNALDWATQNISFDEATELVGKFDIQKYRFMAKPLLELDNIRTKRLTIYKASSAGGTVFLQIAISFWLDQRPGGIQCAMQSDDACDDWMVLRGKKWLSRIPSLSDSMTNDKFAITNKRWQWPHGFLLLTGPGESAQQAKQVRFFASDEAHTELFKPGSLAAFEERMGKRWQRMALHVTTAAHSGKEVDKFYHSGGQNEFHLCCSKCHNFIWPLWEDDSKTQYNGHSVFQFSESDKSPVLVCPFCSAIYCDTTRDRRNLHEGADYVCKNPSHEIENQSYRWNCFGAWFMDWAGHLLKYREAVEAAKLGDLKPHEDWIKKRLCQSYTPHIPNLGEGCGSSDYAIGSVWITEHEKLRTCSFDVQDEGGFHLWAQCDEWLRNGDSRRVDYAKLTTWEQARAFQQHHGAFDADTYCDAGHRMREVFGKCAAWKWFALFADDSDNFPNEEQNPLGPSKPPVTIFRPYSEKNLEDSMQGKAKARLILRTGERRPSVPPGYCISRRWSKPVVGGYLMALKGENSRYYGIAKDINPEYAAQLNSYAYVKDYNKKFGTTTVILKQVKTQDHAFSTSSQCLLGAIIKKYFPLSTQQQTEIAA